MLRREFLKAAAMTVVMPSLPISDLPVLPSGCIVIDDPVSPSHRDMLDATAMAMGLYANRKGFAFVQHPWGASRVQYVAHSWDSNELSMTCRIKQPVEKININCAFEG